MTSFAPTRKLAADVAAAAPVTRTLAVLVVAATVAFDPWGYAPFGPVKWLVVTTLALITAAIAVRTGFAVHRTSAAGWVGFLVWSGAAAVFAVDPLHAWIGTPDRRFGWLAWLCGAAVFLAAQQAAAATDRRIVLRGAVVAAAATAAYGLLELGGVELAGVTSGDRIGGTFGSAAYLAAALTLLIPASAVVAGDPSERAPWRWAAGAAVIAGLVVAVASQTRAGWVGLVVAAAVTAPVWWRWLRTRSWMAAVLAAILVTVVVFSPVAERVSSAVDFDDGGGRARIDEWRIGLAAFAAYPVIGSGPEGYRVVFPDHVDADYARRHGREVAPDRAHNGILDVGITTGLPGAALYVAAAAWLLVRSWRGVRRGDILVIGLAGGVAGYLVQQQFLFPVAEIDPVFWVFAGMLVAATRRQEPWLTVPSSTAAAALIAGLALLVAVAGGADVAADHRAATALDRSADGDHSGALAAADQARTLRPDSIRYHLVAATVAAAAADPDGFEAALDRIETARDRSPADPLLAAHQARILLDAARHSGDDALLAVAREAWRQRTVTDPSHAGHQLEYGVALAVSGDTAAAETAWIAAADLAPGSVAPLRNLATLYLDSGEADRAATMVARALTIAPEDPTLLDLEARIDTAGTS